MIDFEDFTSFIQATSLKVNFLFFKPLISLLAVPTLKIISNSKCFFGLITNFLIFELRNCFDENSPIQIFIPSNASIPFPYQPVFWHNKFQWWLIFLFLAFLPLWVINWFGFPNHLIFYKDFPILGFGNNFLFLVTSIKITRFSYWTVSFLNLRVLYGENRIHFPAFKFKSFIPRIYLLNPIGSQAPIKDFYSFEIPFLVTSLCFLIQILSHLHIINSKSALLITLLMLSLILQFILHN